MAELTVSFTAARDLDAAGRDVIENVLVTAVPHSDRYATGAAIGGDTFIGVWLRLNRPDAEHIVVVPADRSRVDPWWLELGGVTVIIMPAGSTYADRNAKLVELGTNDATEQDVVNEYVNKARRDARRDARRILGKVKAGERAYYQFTMTFDEANKISGEHGGEFLYINPPPVPFPVAGVPVDPDDLSKGIRHPRLGGTECPYLCPDRGRCNKCGWIDPAIHADPVDREAMTARLAELGFAPKDTKTEAPHGTVAS